MHRLAALAACWLLVVCGCQGDFERPQFDNPADPANGVLPPTPSLRFVQSPDCVDDQTRMIIEWEVPDETGILEYQVFRAESEAEDPGELIFHVPAGIQRITDVAVENNTRYIYRVRAVATDGRIGFRSEARSQRARECP